MTTQLASKQPRRDLAEQIKNDLGAIRRVLRTPLEGEIARSGLTAPQVAVLQILTQQGAMSLKDLSRAMNLAHSTVSGIIDRLASKGLVVRRADAKDRRITRLYPSAAIKKFIAEELPKLFEGPLQRALDRTTRTEQAQIGKAIGRLRQLLDESGRTG